MNNNNVKNGTYIYTSPYSHPFDGSTSYMYYHYHHVELEDPHLKEILQYVFTFTIFILTL